MYGPLGQHADSVVAPLLVPDVPVVTWWPDEAPEIPAKHPLGALAQRRVTDSAAAESPREVLAALAAAYQPGDTDFGWTRATPWRSLLAATLDQPHPPVTAGEIAAEAGQPDRRPDRRLAVAAAGRPGVRGPSPAARASPGPRSPRWTGDISDHPPRRPHGHPVLAGPDRPQGRAAPQGHRRAARGGAAPARPRRGLRGDAAATSTSRRRAELPAAGEPDAGELCTSEPAPMSSRDRRVNERTPVSTPEVFVHASGDLLASGRRRADGHPARRRARRRTGTRTWC